MLTEFIHSLRRSTGAMLGWGLSLGILGYYLMQFYDTLADQQATLEQLISQYPPELMAFFGGTDNIFSPAGYLSMEFFSIMPVVMGIYAVMAASSLIVGHEENGILDLVMSYPVSRSALFGGRVLSFATTLAAILGFIWLTFLAGIAVSKDLDISAGNMIRPFLCLYAILFLFGSLSLLFSMVLPSRSMAAMLGGLVMVGSYFIQSLSTINEDLRTIAKYLPLKYYQSGYAVDGLNGNWLLGLFGFGVLFTLLAWLLFLRRDIRVSGEGNWRIYSFKKTRVSE